MTLYRIMSRDSLSFLSEEDKKVEDAITVLVGISSKAAAEMILALQLLQCLVSKSTSFSDIICLINDRVSRTVNCKQSYYGMKELFCNFVLLTVESVII